MTASTRIWASSYLCYAQWAFQLWITPFHKSKLPTDLPFTPWLQLAWYLAMRRYNQTERRTIGHCDSSAAHLLFLEEHFLIALQRADRKEHCIHRQYFYHYKTPVSYLTASLHISSHKDLLLVFKDKTCSTNYHTIHNFSRNLKSAGNWFITGVQQQTQLPPGQPTLPCIRRCSRAYKWWKKITCAVRHITNWVTLWPAGRNPSLTSALPWGISISSSPLLSILLITIFSLQSIWP